MVYYTNECMGCDWYTCDGCRQMHVPHFVCDVCGEEVEDEWELLDDNGEELCKKCYERRYTEDE